MTEKTGEKQKSTRFQKGQSGNLKGRPLGARNKASIMAEQLFAQDIQSICKAVITKANNGDMQAAKIILDRLLPPRKDIPIRIRLPKIQTVDDILKAIAEITWAVSLGKISPSEGETLVRILDINAKAIELYEFENRLTELERRGEGETN